MYVGISSFVQDNDAEEALGKFARPQAKFETKN